MQVLGSIFHLQHRKTEVVERAVHKFIHFLPLYIALRVEFFFRFDFAHEMRIDDQQVRILIVTHVDSSDALRCCVHVSSHHDQSTVLLEILLQRIAMFGNAIFLRYVDNLTRNVEQGINHVDGLQGTDPLTRAEKPLRFVLYLDQRLLNGWNVRYLLVYAFILDDPRAN